MITSIHDVPVSQLKTDYIKIENLKQFLIDIEQINPDDFQRYLTYWRNVKNLIIEGTWGKEFGKYRYAPGCLIFHGSLTLIQDTDANKTTIHIKPLIRDLEWELAYGMLEAKGFSGYHLDTKYTSFHGILNYKEDLYKKIDSRVLFQPNGKFKEYIPVRENIRMLHDKPKGSPLYLNESKNFNCLGSRGGGKCLSLDEKVRVEKGWKEINNIEVGDLVYGSDGKLAKVTNKSEVQDLPFFNIKLRDGREIEACEDHLWKVWYKGEYKVLNTKSLYKNTTTQE